MHRFLLPKIHVYPTLLMKESDVTCCIWAGNDARQKGLGNEICALSKRCYSIPPAVRDKSSVQGQLAKKDAVYVRIRFS